MPWIRNRRAGGSSSRGRRPSLLLRCSWVDSVCADGATEILRESAMISCLATRKELFPIAPVAHLNAGSFSNHPQSLRYLSSKFRFCSFLTRSLSSCASAASARALVLASDASAASARSKTVSGMV